MRCSTTLRNIIWGPTMLDILLLAAGLAVFGLLAIYAQGCGRV
jgi:hypothetical protein